jgi:menaquinone-9 beta-reductase
MVASPGRPQVHFTLLRLPIHQPDAAREKTTLEGFAGIEARDAVEMYFFQGGYCGLAPVEGGAYNACFLVDRAPARSYGGGIGDFRAWITKVAGHHGLDARFADGVQISETIATAPACPARRSSEIAGALLAGDAAGFLDPFTGDGISMALHNGRVAA